MHVTRFDEGRRTREVLGPHVSCRFAPGEARQLLNETNRPATVLLAMANAAPAA